MKWSWSRGQGAMREMKWSLQKRSGKSERDEVVPAGEVREQ